MASPAERYAASRARGARRHLTAFADGFDFPLDEFQLRACEALEAGEGVLVAAPTGAGKTLVGEFAVHLALERGFKAFYTTPIKALSNQKYADLVRRHGPQRVGLLTGDSSINGDADVVVMTTEVLRNMLYTGSDSLDRLGYVVMDEVHYLADRFRGAVWEEVIIHLPRDVIVVSLSATVSNAEEFGAWLGTVRGQTRVVVEERRPVPLWQHMMVGRRLYDLFVETTGDDDQGHTTINAVVNPELIEAIETFRRGTDRRGRLLDAGGPRGRRGTARGAPSSYESDGARRRKGANSRGATRGAPAAAGTRDVVAPAGGGRPSRAEVIDRLDRAGLLPAITFIFSRAGCDAAVGQLLAWGTRLVDDDEAEAIRELVETRIAGLATEDLHVLGYWDFVEGLTRGFAAHHAGMLPTFREIVEELFTSGRIKAVFATETLALGINMPARSVVLEKLVKFNGIAHADITPAEYTQLTGRAGRRGIDVEGHAVVVWNAHLDPAVVGGLASTRTYPLRSSFRPNPNMAANLVAEFGRDRARQVLETSFAQFQADRSVAGHLRTIHRYEEALAGYAEAMTCHLGDFTAYAALRRELADAEKGANRARNASRRAAVGAALEAARPGDVLRLSMGRASTRAVVLTGAFAHTRDAVVSVLTEDARTRRVGAGDLAEPPPLIGHVAIPRTFSPRTAKDRRDLASRMRSTIHPDARPVTPAPEELAPRGRTRPAGGRRGKAPTAGDAQERIDELRRALRAHPCHRCPDREQHARWAERWWRLHRETEGLRRTVAGRTSSVACTFDRLCDLLAELGYLDEAGERITANGQRLRRIYSERDLLVAECLRRGLWSRLDAPALAAVVSALVHEPRREEVEAFPRMPADVAAAYEEMLRAWDELRDREHAHDLPSAAEPDAGIAWLIHRWARGQSLEAVLRDADLAAGDFVRRCKQLVDLLDQIAQVAPDAGLRTTARRAVDAVLRGVVAADRLD